MDDRSEMFPGDALFDQDRSFAGLVGGSLTIAPGVKVVLGGMVRGDLILGEGAEVELRGMVGGRLVNQGGKLSGTGMIADC